MADGTEDVFARLEAERAAQDLARRLQELQDETGPDCE